MKIKSSLKQRVFNSLISVLCCIAFTGCDQEKNSLTPDEGMDVLQLNANITGLTRANDAGFETGDSLGVFVVKWVSDIKQDSLRETGNYSDNICFRLDQLSNDWVADKITYYPNDDNMVDLYAYYPYRNPALNGGTVINLLVEDNQASYRNYTRSDFMVAQTDSVSRSPFKVPLIFSHKLSQMVFELKPGAGFTVNDLVNAKIKVINAITDATFDLATIKTGKPTAGTTRADITPCGTWTEVNGSLTGKKAIVVPQPINTTTYIQVKIGARTFTYKPTNDVNMNIGCSRKFVITINNTGLDITTAINPWDNCPLVEGEAGEEFQDTYKPIKAIRKLKYGTDALNWADNRKAGGIAIVKATWSSDWKYYTVVFEVDQNRILDGWDIESTLTKEWYVPTRPFMAGLDYSIEETFSLTFDDLHDLVMNDSTKILMSNNSKQVISNATLRNMMKNDHAVFTIMYETEPSSRTSWAISAFDSFFVAEAYWVKGDKREAFEFTTEW